MPLVGEEGLGNAAWFRRPPRYISRTPGRCREDPAVPPVAADRARRARGPVHPHPSDSPSTP